MFFEFSLTGDPKGAMLTHKNYTATVASLSRHMQLLEIGPGDIIFSYLPLAHTFEQVSPILSFLLTWSVSVHQTRAHVTKLFFRVGGDKHYDGLWLRHWNLSR